MDHKTNLVLHISFSFFFLFLVHCLYSIVFLISFMDFLINNCILYLVISGHMQRIHKPEHYAILVISGHMQRIHKPEHYVILIIQGHMQHIHKPEHYVILVISGYMQRIHKMEHYVILVI